MKPCPYCSEPIQEDAKKCKHCGEYLDPALRQAGGEAVALANQAAIEAAKKKANQAFWYSIVGIFFFGIILGPAAFIKAGSANKTLTELGQPPDGKATTARVLGAIVTVFWVIGVLARVLEIAGR